MSYEIENSWKDTLPQECLLNLLPYGLFTEKIYDKIAPLIRNKRNTIIKQIHKKLPVKHLHLMSHRIHLDTKKVIFKKYMTKYQRIQLYMEKQLPLYYLESQSEIYEKGPHPYKQYDYVIHTDTHVPYIISKVSDNKKFVYVYEIETSDEVTRILQCNRNAIFDSHWKTICQEIVKWHIYKKPHIYKIHMAIDKDDCLDHFIQPVRMNIWDVQYIGECKPYEIHLKPRHYKLYVKEMNSLFHRCRFWKFVLFPMFGNTCIFSNHWFNLKFNVLSYSKPPLARHKNPSNQYTWISQWTVAIHLMKLHNLQNLQYP